MTYQAKALTKAEDGKPRIANNTLLCCCPDCAAPMTVRVWLGLANCWRCGTSIQLSVDQIRRMKSDAQTTQETTRPRPRNERRPRELQRVRRNRPPSQRQSEPPEVAIDSRRFNAPWPFIISFLLNGLIILILAILFFNQTLPFQSIELEVRPPSPGNENRSVMDLAPVAIIQPTTAKVAATPEAVSEPTEFDAAGQGDQVTFFDTKATGRRFVYIVDRSGSMNTVGNCLRGSCAAFQNQYENRIRSRFDSAMFELIRSVASLNSNQEFYVFLFSDDAVYLFDDVEDTTPDLVAATDSNKQRLANWLTRCIANGGTNPTRSIKLAIRMEPDAIFLLSDGEFMIPSNQPHPISVIRSNPDIPIHTIAYEDEYSKGNLQELSEQTGGQFRFVSMNQRFASIVSSHSRSEVKSGLASIANLPNHNWDWDQRLEFARLLLHASRSKPQSNSYIQAVAHVAFGTQPFTSDLDFADNWDNQRAGRREWQQFLKESDVLYRQLKHEIQGSTNPIGHLDVKNSTTQLVGMQLFCEQFMNPNVARREQFTSKLQNYLSTSGRGRFLQPLHDSAAVSSANTPVVFQTLSILGLLSLDRNARLCDRFLKQNDSPLQKLEIANTLIALQQRFGATDESHFLLSQIFTSQSPNLNAKDLSRSWKRLFHDTLDERRSKARKIYREFQRLSTTKREKTGRMLITKYPETSYARTVRRKLGL